MRPIHTSRLVIRPISSSDLADICEYGCDADTGQYMLYWPKTVEEIRAFIEASSAVMALEPAAWYKLALQLRDSEKVIGHISLVPDDEQQWEIAWVMNGAYRNRGYMTEAVRAVIDFAQHQLDINRVFATCAEANAASYRVMEKCGMARIKEELYRAVKGGKEVEFQRLTYCLEKQK